MQPILLAIDSIAAHCDGYGLVFGAVRLRFWGQKAEQAALAKSFDNKTVTAVLRPLPKKQVAILMSAEVKKWMTDQIEPLLNALPKEIADIAKQLVDWIKADSDFGLFCKQNSNGALQLGVMEEKEENGKLAKSTAWKNKLSIDLGGAAVFPSAVVPSQGARVQIELDPIF